MPYGMSIANSTTTQLKRNEIVKQIPRMEGVIRGELKPAIIGFSIEQSTNNLI